MTALGPGAPPARRPRLGFLDRYLTWWIGGAMVTGLLLGRYLPGAVHTLGSWVIPGTPVPLAVGLGLIVMMYPPLARVRYEEMGRVFRNGRLLLLTLVQNWFVGPLLMFGLAVVFLHGFPGLLIGLIMIGSARCIAMVLVWNQLAGGDREYAAGLVAFNSLFQVFFYGLYIYLFVAVLLPLVGLASVAVPISWDLVVLSVGIFLGLPFLAGFLTRWSFVRRGQREYHDRRFAPSLAPLSLVALLYTVVAMFAFQSSSFLAAPQEVLYVAIPLSIYFVVMFLVSFAMALRARADYARTAALSLTAASNNIELAITVAVAVFGISSAEALAATVGPLIEVPVLLALVQLSLRLERRFFPVGPAVREPRPEDPISQGPGPASP